MEIKQLKLEIFEAERLIERNKAILNLNEQLFELKQELAKLQEKEGV